MGRQKQLTHEKTGKIGLYRISTLHRNNSGRHTFFYQVPAIGTSKWHVNSTRYHYQQVLKKANTPNANGFFDPKKTEQQCVKAF